MAKTMGLFELSMTSNANVRAVLGFFHTNMLAFGWVQTADTGQLDPTTVTFVSAGNDTTTGSMGYLIYHSNDGLTDYYVKFEFFRSSSVDLWIKVTLGWGSNGTGTITDNNASCQVISNTKSYTGVHQWAMAGGPGWLTFVGNGVDVQDVSAPVNFHLERDRDNTGAEVNTGIMCWWYNALSPNFQFVPSSGTVPAAQPWWAACWFTTGSILGATTTSWTSTRMEQKLFLIFGVPIKESGAGNHSLGVAWSPDIVTGMITKVTNYGATHAYLSSHARAMNGNPHLLWRFE